MDADILQIFANSSDEKHYAPNTYSEIPRNKTNLNITSGQNANWTYANFFVQNDIDEVESFRINEGQYLIVKRNGIWQLIDFSNQVIAEGLDEIKKFVDYVAYANKRREDLLKHFNQGNSHCQPSHKVNPGASTRENIDKYLAAIRTKPFLLLAGISGTGKSRIVKEMAFATCPNVDDLRSDAVSPGNYCLIEVKPNWHDSTELLGYHSNIKNQYFVTKFMQFVVKAMQYPNVPFFVCLDEMNLAPVEQYFAEFLSVLESRKRVGNEIVSEPLIEAGVFTHNYGDWDIFSKLGLKKVVKSVGTNETNRVSGEVTTEAFERQDIVETLKEKGLRIPQNLVVIGTVNMDETTHQFSRKVIDRAMTIEMNEVDFASFFEQSNELGYFEEVLPVELFRAEYTSAKDALESLPTGDQTYIKSQTQTSLAELNKALEATPFKVAYRVQNELVLYFHALRQENKEESTEALFTTALDHIMMMKVLPRIEGDDQLLEKPLVRLADFANTNNLTLSSAKIEEMSERLNSAHFTSFWP